MNKVLRRMLTCLLLFFFLYVGSYIAFRNSNIEVWAADKSEYVIFPEDKILYYLFRPIVLADGMFTGMKFHIGPHQ